MPATRTDLVTNAEVARILGVSRQRAHAMAKNPVRGFPKPYADTANGPLYRRADVEKFAASRRRR